MEHLLELVYGYGYVIIFIGTLFEGETFVALGGFAAYQEHLSLGILIPVAILGAFVGDNAFFWTGRLKGASLVRRFPALAPKVEVAKKHLERHHLWLIATSRFMYGFRAMLPIAFGMSRIPAWKFMALNFLGAVAWGFLFAFGGFLFGNAVETFIGNVKRYEGYFVLAILIIVGCVQVAFWLRRRSARRASRSLPGNEDCSHTLR
jgi:membrane protein DedA with SNARE-associated domain